jgi:endonuclease/exonuclease/phosphatase (EEP) superfamily protein YafD
MRLLFWNLEKRGLAPWALENFDPDFALFQEHWLKVNFNKKYFTSLVYTTESYKKKNSPCGTAIYTKSQYQATKVLRLVTSQKEFFISMRKTATAIEVDGKFWLMSIHNYNGWPFRSIEKFLKCIEEFVQNIPKGVPAIVAGDFNSFTIEHIEAMDQLMRWQFGFERKVSVDYGDGRKLDHVYTRGMTTYFVSSGKDASDHPYCLVDVELI